MTNNFLPQGRGLRKYSMILAIAGLATVFTSCLKNDGPPAETNVAALSVINASPNARNVNFFLDDTRINTSGIPYLSGLQYIRAFSGPRETTVTDFTTNGKLAEKTFTLATGNYYSLYIVGVGATPDSLNYVFTIDSLKAPASGKTRIRFVNLSPDSAPLSLAVEGQTTNLVSNQAYKAVSQFVNVDPIASGVLVIKDNATGAVIGRLENTTLQAGFNYSILARGIAASTVNDLKPGIKVINHNSL